MRRLIQLIRALVQLLARHKKKAAGGGVLALAVGGAVATLAYDYDDDGFADPVDGCNGLIYGGTIVVPDAIDSTAESDLETTLEDITGEAFTKVTELTGSCLSENQQAIHVRLTGNLGAAAPAEVVAMAEQITTGGNRQAYGIWGRNGQGLWIIGERTSSVRHGIYGYLKHLGVRWIAPADNWKVTPPRRYDIRWIHEQVHSPAIATILPLPAGQVPPTVANNGPALPSAFGTHDEIDDIVYQWDRWEDRNRIPEAARMVGYTSFATTYTATFCADNEYLAETPAGSGHQSYTCPTPTAAELLYKYHYTFTDDCDGGCTDDRESCTTADEEACDYTSYNGFIKLWGDHHATGIASNMATYGHDHPWSQFIRSEPPDGDGHCDCEKCQNLLKFGPYFTPDASRAISSVSDRVFHAANEVAKKLVRTPGVGDRGAALNAYSHYAAVPTIPLEKNILVGVQPYSAQLEITRATPEELEDGWGTKAAQEGFKIGIADLWVPAQSTSTSAAGRGWDTPIMTIHEAIDRASRWRSKGFSYLALETTRAWPAVGLHFIMATDISWDGTIDSTDEVNKLLKDAFGPAYVPMKSLFDRWWTRFDLNVHTLGLAFDDIATAEPLVSGNSPYEERVADVKAYVHWLRLFHDADVAHRTCDTDYAGYEAASEALLEYGWQIYPRNLVQSWWWHKRTLGRWTLGQNYHCTSEQSASLLAKWALPPSEGAGWATLTPLTDTALDALSTTSSLTLDDTPSGSPSTPVDDCSGDCSGTVDSMALRGDPEHPAVFRYHARSTENLTVALRIQRERGSESYVGLGYAKVRATVTSSDGTVMYNEDLATHGTQYSWISHDITISATAGQTYTLTVIAFDDTHNFIMRVDKDIPFMQVDPIYVWRDFDTTTDLYFWVPTGASKFAIFWENNIGLDVTFKDSGGSAVTPTKHGANLWEVTVPNGEDGAVWSLAGASSLTNDDSPQFYGLTTAFATSAEQVMRVP